MAVVDNKSDLDLEALEGDTGVADFSKGLSPEEKKVREVKHDIQFAKYKASQFGIKKTKEELSVKTATPGKTILASRKVTGEDTMAQSIITYDTKTMVGNVNIKEVEDDSSLSSGLSVDSVDRKDIREFESKLEESRMVAHLEGSISLTMALPTQLHNPTARQQSTLSPLQNENSSERSFSHDFLFQPVEPPTLNRVIQEENEARKTLTKTDNIHFPLTQETITDIINLVQSTNSEQTDTNGLLSLDKHSESLIVEIFPYLDASFSNTSTWVKDIENILNYMEANKSVEQKSFVTSRIEYSKLLDNSMLTFLQEKCGNDYVHMASYLTEVKNAVKKKIDIVNALDLQHNTGKIQSYPTHTNHPDKDSGKSKLDKGTKKCVIGGQVTP